MNTTFHLGELTLTILRSHAESIIEKPTERFLVSPESDGFFHLECSQALYLLMQFSEYIDPEGEFAAVHRISFTGARQKGEDEVRRDVHLIKRFAKATLDRTQELLEAVA